MVHASRVHAELELILRKHLKSSPNSFNRLPLSKDRHSLWACNVHVCSMLASSPLLALLVQLTTIGHQEIMVHASWIHAELELILRNHLIVIVSVDN